jgi:hypothetical protein
VLQDKNVVVLPRELTRHDIRLIMYNVLDIFGTTSNEKSIITRNTIQQLGFVQEVCLTASVTAGCQVLIAGARAYSCVANIQKRIKALPTIYFNIPAGLCPGDVLHLPWPVCVVANY